MPAIDANLSGRPLRDTKADMALFVDREREIKLIRRALQANLNCLVLGERGSGRTTLLKHLAYRARVTWREPYVFIEGRIAPDAKSFLSLLRYSLQRDQEISAGDALARTARLAGGLLSGEAALSAAVPRHETEELLRLYAEAREAAEQRPGCIVFVDELSSPELAHTIFGRFRDETWALPLRWVVAGDAEARATYLTPPADAFFEVVVELAALSDTAAAELLRRRAEGELLPASHIETLMAVAAGNPSRLLAAAREVFIEGVSPRQLGARRDRRNSRLAALGPSARRLAEDLESFGPASASDRELLSRLGWTRGRAAQVFRQLEEADLVRGSSRRSATGGPDRKVYELVDKR